MAEIDPNKQKARQMQVCFQCQVQSGMCAHEGKG